MELSIKERFVLLHTLPREANLATLKIVRELKESLSFSEEEHKNYKINMSKEGFVSWDEKVTNKKDIKIGEKATDIIIGSLQGLDKTNKLTEDHICLWELFIK